MNLQNPNISYLILSSGNIDDMTSVLYAKEYQILPLQSYYKEAFNESAMGYSDVDNDTLRKDTLFILNHFHQESAIIKYKGETVPKKIFRDGSEKILELNMYNTNSELVSYLYRGLSFSFVDAKRYWVPRSKEDFKAGMVVEYFNNNQWTEKVVENPNVEWDKLYKLLLKYDKVRVQSKN